MFFQNQYLITAFIGIWLLVITFLLLRLQLHYQRLTGSVNKKDLMSSLNNIISQTKASKDDIDKLKLELDRVISEDKFHLQRIGFKRFNPFTDTGGDQSFALSLLDENSNGIVISSLHSRESTRIYAKKITDGQPANQVLSKEEAEVIKNSISGKTVVK